MNNYDESNNLLFNIGEKEYRIFRCNWRVQRAMLSLLLKTQVGESSMMFGEKEVLDSNDQLIAMVQFKVNDSWVQLEPKHADIHINSIKEYTEIYEKLVEVITLFLEQGEESSPQKSGEKSTNKVNRPSNT